VRKITGFNKPSKANEAAFLAAIDEVAAASTRLLHSLEPAPLPKIANKKPQRPKAARPKDSAPDSALWCVARAFRPEAFPSATAKLKAAL